MKLKLKEIQHNIKLSIIYFIYLKRFYYQNYIRTNYLISKIIITEFTNLFSMANNLILSGTQPIPLNITIDKFSDLRKSCSIDTTRFLLSNFIGAADDLLNFNIIINNITNNTEIIYLHDFYNETILFNFNVSDKNNNSLGY